MHPPADHSDGPDAVPADLFRQLVAHTDDVALVLLAPDGTVRSWNAGAERLHRRPAAEVVGRSFAGFHDPDSAAARHPELVLEQAEAAGRYDDAGWRVRPDGSRFWARDAITALHGEHGAVVGYALVTTDLTAAKDAQDQAASARELLRTTARTDAPTGFLNRRGWNEELGREVALAERRGTPLCIAALELENVKQITDVGGREAREALLRGLRGAWRTKMRATDVLARTGDDDFAVALVDCDVDTAMTIVERLRAATPDEAGCTAVVALWDGDEGAGELTRRAERALRAARRDGRHRTVLASADDDVERALRPDDEA